MSLPNIYNPSWFLEICKLFLIIVTAVEKLAALKNIKANATKEKVTDDCTNLLMNSFLDIPVAALNFALKVSVARAKTKYKPCSAPQITNVQLAPCHKPLTAKTTNWLK